MRVYLDYNSTAPLSNAARHAMSQCLDQNRGAGNPSSPHWAGRVARRLLEESREIVAAVLGAEPFEVIFTSGGTEGNNLALCGIPSLPLLTCAIEHSSILRCAAELERSRKRQVELLPVDCNGRLDPSRLDHAIARRRCLVSVGLANNEVGTIQDIEALAAVIQARQGILHLDAVQAAGKLPICVKDIRADLLTISAHKLGGPGGIGALYVRRGVALCELLRGGAQEGGKRAGTENVLGAVGFAAALAEAEAQRPGETTRLAELREKLWRGILDIAPSAVRNSPSQAVLSNTLNVSFPGLEGAVLAGALDLEGIAVSTGSACAAGAAEPSHVLKAMGKTEEEVRGALRLSLGSETRLDDIGYVLQKLNRVLERLGYTSAGAKPLEAGWAKDA